MKTSFTKTIETDKFLCGEMPPQDALTFEARLLVDEELKRDTFLHRIVHRMVLLYGRKHKKAEAEAVHVRLFSDPQKSALRETIHEIFNP